MVIYSACICTKAGKILVARQFVQISKIKIEEHISSLPKHLATAQQHTQIEVGNIRYLYIPIQDLMLVLISSKASNVIEDMEILKLLYGIVIEKCKEGGVSEKKIMSCAFDLILAFDDVVTLGYRESVSVGQVMEYLEMDSSEEKTFIKQQKMRENEAKELTKRKQQEIDKKKRQKAKEYIIIIRNFLILILDNRKSSISSGRIGEMSDISSTSIAALKEAPKPAPKYFWLIKIITKQN